MVIILHNSIICNKNFSISRLIYTPRVFKPAHVNRPPFDLIAFLLWFPFFSLPRVG